MFCADAVKNFASRFAFARLHFIQPALNTAQGICKIIRALTTRFQHTSIFADGMLFGFTQSRLHAVKNEFTRKQSQMRTWEIEARSQNSFVRSDIFVETRTNKIPSPVGAAYSGNGYAEDAAPDGA